MSFGNYSALQTEIATWLSRSDLTASIPGFIRLAEAQLNRRLRCAAMISRDTAFAITGATVAAPTDFVAPRTFRLTSTTPGAMMTWVAPEKMDDLLDGYDYTAGQPRHYTVEGGNFRFSPSPGSSYTASLSYYAAVPALATEDTNWVLEAHPDAYLYGALAESAPFLRADDRLPMWERKFGQIIEDINSSDSGMGGALDVLPGTYGAGAI